ncbi:MAG: LuxR C-terminal-related transcriptional regulator [Candidatus Kapaibacterium sp.]
MSRKRTSHIQESLEFLQHLETNHQGERKEARVRMLRLLKENPERTLDQVAELGGLSLRSVSRWWGIYQERGISGILGNGISEVPQPQRLGREELGELKQKLQAGELSTLSDIQEWIEKRFGLRYSLKGIAKILQRRLKARHIWVIPGPKEIKPKSIQATTALVERQIIPAKVVQFLNRLPLTSDVQMAVETYRSALMGLLGEVDRISIYVNIRCNLAEPESYTADLIIMLDNKVTVEAAGPMVSGSNQDGIKMSERLLTNFRNQGMPVDTYYDPVAMDYYYNDQAYLGTIFLWRERSKPPLSPQVVETLSAIEPFTIYMLSDLITRYHYSHPTDRLFHDTLYHMAMDAGLSMQERRVVALRMLGHAYKEIADQLNITEDAIKKHLSSVHRKTGTRSYTELFAKYFTPRLNVKDA